MQYLGALTTWQANDSFCSYECQMALLDFTLSKRQTILLVNGEPLRVERVNLTIVFFSNKANNNH